MDSNIGNSLQVAIPPLSTNQNQSSSSSLSIHESRRGQRLRSTIFSQQSTVKMTRTVLSFSAAHDCAAAATAQLAERDEIFDLYKEFYYFFKVLFVCLFTYLFLRSAPKTGYTYAETKSYRSRSPAQMPPAYSPNLSRLRIGRAGSTAGSSSVTHIEEASSVSLRRHSELPGRSPTQSLAPSLAVTDDSRMPCALFFSHPLVYAL